MAPGIEGGMFLQSEGIDGHGGATARGRAAQDAGARGVVDIQILVLRASIPTNEVIKQVVGEGRRGAAGVTAGDVASAIVAAGVDLPRFGGAGGTGAIETGELVRLAVTIEVLLLRATAAQRPLPQLT